MISSGNFPRRGTNKLGQPLVLGRPKRSKLDDHLEEIKQMIEDGVKFSAIAKKYQCGNNLITTFCKKHKLKDYSKEKLNIPT